MFLTKDGITIEVTHPAEIRHYKALGFAEVKRPAAEPPAAVEPSPELTPEELNAEAIRVVNESKGTPRVPKKGGEK